MIKNITVLTMLLLSFKSFALPNVENLSELAHKNDFVSTKNYVPQSPAEQIALTAIENTGGFMRYKSALEMTAIKGGTFKAIWGGAKAAAGVLGEDKNLGKVVSGTVGAGIGVEIATRGRNHGMMQEAEKYDDYSQTKDFKKIVNKLLAEFAEIDKKISEEEDKDPTKSCKDPVYAKSMYDGLINLTPSQFNKTININLLSRNNYSRDNTGHYFAVDTYKNNGKLKSFPKDKGEFEQIDHVPSFQTVSLFLEKKAGKYNSRGSNLDFNATTIVTPTIAHKSGRTYGNYIKGDENQMRRATLLDLSAILYNLKRNKEFVKIIDQKTLKEMYEDYQISAIVLYYRNKQLCLYE